MNKNKHDHKATKKLKVFLFALFMILPFLVWIPNAFYYGFNKDAVAQTNTQTIETNNYFNWSINEQEYAYNELDAETIYFMTINELDYNADANYTDFSYLKITTYDGGPSYIAIDEGEYKYGLQISYENDYINIFINNTLYYYEDVHIANGFDLRFEFALPNNYDTTTWNSFISPINRLYIEGISYDYLIPSDTNTTTTNTYTMSITDSMSVAWQQTWSNPLFSWNNSNPLLEPLTNFTNVFGITTDSCIPQALCYLATITMIYVVFDIIIELFTKLTHLINRSD